MPFPFAFAMLNALQAAVRHSTVYQTHVFAKLHKQIEHWLHLKNILNSNGNKKDWTAMTALSKFSVLLAIFLLENLGDAFMNLSSAAENLVPVNHWIRFVEPMSKPMKEPTGKPTEWTEVPNILTSKQGKCSLSEKQDAELPSKINVSITQFSSDTSYMFEAVHDMSHVHVKYIVTGWVMFSDRQDNEIQSKCPDESLPWPNEWQMQDKINLDSSSLRQPTQTEVLYRRDKVYSHSTLKKLKQSLKHACLVLISFFGAISAESKHGVHPIRFLQQVFQSMGYATIKNQSK
jgi:hypothetical protein